MTEFGRALLNTDRVNSTNLPDWFGVCIFGGATFSYHLLTI